MHVIRPFAFCVVELAIATCFAIERPAEAAGKLTVVVVDKDSGEPLACRMHLENAKGKAVRAEKQPFWHDHFVFSDRITIELPRGRYSFEIERGPEYRQWTGYFVLENGAHDERLVELERIVDMADEGWFSGDLHVHRPLDDIELLMQAEDLYVAPVITWWNKENPWSESGFATDRVHTFDGRRYYDVTAGEDERGGGALLYFGLPRPLDIASAGREYPSMLDFLRRARSEPGAWIDIEKPFWWDVPIWLALAQVDSIGLANNHMNRAGMMDNEAWGKPRDTARFPSPRGNGEWSQEIYYRILNCGFRIPPSAGSASGVLPNPVGYNRLYVWVDPREYDYESWWEGLRAGRVVVTNGPLLRPRANGELPGHVFRSPEKLTIELTGAMAWRDKVEYVEIVKDGLVVVNYAMSEWAETGRLPPIEFDESGWFLVRAIADVDETFRFASSGPWYVEIGDNPRRIDPAAVSFFQDWVAQRTETLALDETDQRREVFEQLGQAREFWDDLASRAATR